MVGSEEMKTWDLYWGPEGRKIATVQASTPMAAIRKTPQPWRKYRGEVYAQEVLTDVVYLSVPVEPGTIEKLKAVDRMGY